MPKKKLTISNNGISFLKLEEGKHDGNPSTPLWEPKKDPIGLYTLGYGSRYDKNGKEVTSKTPAITEQEAEALLRRDIGIAENAINTQVVRDMTQNQFDAVCSLIFNIGIGNFKKSLLLKHLNSGTVREVHFTAWKNAGGQPILLKRRKREWALYCKT